MSLASTMMDVPLSLNALLDRAGRLFGDSKLISRRPDKSYVEHTYAQYHARTRALAAALLELGLAPGDRVATLCWNHHAHLECYFGIPAAGGVMHTLNLRLAPAEIGWIAADAGDRFLIVDDVLLPLYEQFAALHRFEKVIVFDFSGQGPRGGADRLDYDTLVEAAMAAGRALQYPAHDEDAPVAMCYTSGTTGSPKGVVYSHRSTVVHTLVASLPDHWALKGADRVFPVTPMFHANAWGVPYAGLMLGCDFLFPGPLLHPEDLLDCIQQHRPTMTLGVPTIWLSMIQLYEAHPGRWQFPPNLRSLVGGAAVPEALIRAFAKHGVAIQQGWGMTETSPLATIFFEKTGMTGLTEDAWFQRRAMAGVPVPLVDFRLMTEDGPAPWDGETVGEIQVRGPFITGAYHGIAADPEKFTPDGWLRTGDVGAIDAHGYLRISDRTKDLIKSGGEWISSVDLENALMAHPAIAEAAVIAVPHPRWSERPLACVVPRPGRTIDEAELRAFLGQRFAKWQVPDAYVTLDAIPRTSTGKFWKKQLRERFPAWNWPDAPK